MKSGEFTGHSMDEAVFHGLQELGLSIDEVVIETLQSETKGLFGIGAKLARVRLTQRDPDEIYEAEAPRAHTEEYPPREQREARYDQRSERRSPQGYGRQNERPARANQGGYRNKESAPPTPAVHYDYQAALAKELPAGQFLEGLLERMHVEAEVLAAQTEDGIRLRIDSDTRGLLIGRRGETLDAMQYLTSLHVNRTAKQEKYLRVTLDTEDYRSKREDTLMRLARRQAAHAKASGRPVSMEPMNPYERRVLHASLQNNPYVTTHSEGEEPNRRVIITPKR